MRTILILLTVITALQCRDYYIGMFKRGDFLAAQDTVYKERRPYGRVEADYGRLFKCKITYFRVVDRLGKGPGPIVRVLKGGLQKNYISIRLRSGYNLPISVNIYVGCPNINLKDRIPPIRPTKPKKPTSTKPTLPTSTKGEKPKNESNSENAAGGANSEKPAGGANSESVNLEKAAGGLNSSSTNTSSSSNSSLVD